MSSAVMRNFLQFCDIQVRLMSGYCNELTAFASLLKFKIVTNAFYFGDYAFSYKNR